MLLLLYIREDAVVVRQPIYGLLFGNVLLFALAFVMRHHTFVALAPGRAADFAFLNEMGALMVWGTAILFFDCILIILLYERSRTWFGDHVFPRLALCGALVLTFDQAAFFAGLHKYFLFIYFIFRTGLATTFFRGSPYAGRWCSRSIRRHFSPVCICLPAPASTS